jgi:hypothetical protein
MTGTPQQMPGGQQQQSASGGGPQTLGGQGEGGEAA